MVQYLVKHTDFTCYLFTKSLLKFLTQSNLKWHTKFILHILHKLLLHSPQIFWHYEGWLWNHSSLLTSWKRICLQVKLDNEKNVHSHIIIHSVLLPLTTTHKKIVLLSRIVSIKILVLLCIQPKENVEEKSCNFKHD